MLNFIAPADHSPAEALPGLARMPHSHVAPPPHLAPHPHLADFPRRLPQAAVTRPAPLETPMTRWLAAMLDEIDYPMVLVNGESQLLHANQVARADMDNDHPLQLLGDELRVLHSQDVAPLREALQAAQQRGLRRLLTLGAEGQPVTVAVVPMPAIDGTTPRAVLLVLGKRQVCEQLSAQWFAREHNLTPAETQVLDALCAGLRPQEVAVQHGVAISTVRSQISSIRSKTGAQSIRALVRQVAVLPPLLNALRSLGRMNATMN